MKRELRTVISALLLFVCARQATAACDAAADPCGPKKVLDSWEKSLAAGLNLTRGNSDTLLLTLLAQARRETDQDIIRFDASYGYGEDSTNTADGEDSTTRNDARVTAGYNYLLSERTFVGGIVDFRYDEIADIDYRFTLSPTVGYYFLKDADFKFSGDIGPSYVFEKVGGEENDYFAPRIGERFEWVISCTSKLYQSAEILYDVEDSDNYMMNAEAGVEAAIATNLALVVLLRDNYDNLPAADREKNDLTLITALKVAL